MQEPQDPIARTRQRYGLTPSSAQEKAGVKSVGAGASWGLGGVERSTEQTDDPISRTRKLYGKDEETNRKPEKTPGLMSYLGNMSKNMYTLVHALVNEPTENDSAELSVLREAMASAEGTATKVVMDDFLHMFDKTFADIKGSVTAIKAAPLDFAKAVADDPIAMVGQFAKMFIEPLGGLVEETAGITLADETVRPLTVEERKDRIKNALGFATMLGTTRVLSSGLKAATVVEAAQTAKMAAVGAEVASQIAPKVAKTAFRDLLTPTQYLKTGAFAKELSRKTAIGGISGTAYAAVRFANDDQQLVEMFNNLITFAPLGAAIDLIGLPAEIKAHNKNTVSAGRALMTHMAQNVNDNTLAGVISNVENLATSRTMLEGLVKGTLDVEPNHTMYFTGITDEDMVGLATLKRTRNLGPEDKIRVALTGIELPSDYVSTNSGDLLIEGPKSKDGLRDILVIGRDSPITERAVEQFQTYGRFVGQKISHQGRDWSIRQINGIGETFSILSDDGTSIKNNIPFSEIVSTVGDQAGLHTQMVASPHSLKGMLVVMAKSLGFKDPEAFLYRGTGGSRARGEVLRFFGIDPQIYANIETGKPVSIIGFRQGNPRTGVYGGVEGTGRFYSNDPFYAASYATMNLDRPGANAPTNVHWNNFQVHRINLENPIMVNGGHREFIKMIEEKYGGEGVTPVYDISGMAKKWGVTEQDVRDAIGNPEDINASIEGLKRQITQGHRFGPDDITFFNKMLGVYQTIKTTKSAFAKLGSLKQTYMAKWVADLGQKYGLEIREVEKLRRAHKQLEHTPKDLVEREGFSLEDAKAFIKDIENEPTVPSLKQNKAGGFQKEIAAFRAAERDLPMGEQAYIHKGKIVAKIAKELGHDGIIYHGGKEIVDLRGVAQKEVGVKIPVQALGQETQASFLNKMYESFLADLSERVYVHNRDRNAIAQNNERIKTNYVPHGRSLHEMLADEIPPFDYNFTKEFSTWAASKGFLPKEIPALRREMQGRLARGILNEVLDTDDKQFFKDLSKKMEAETVERHKLDSNTLAKYAMKAGYFISREDGGHISIRDAQGHKLNGSLKTFAEVQAWIQNAGQEIGYNIGGGDGTIPPDGFMGDLLEPPDPTPDFDSVVGGRTRVSKVIDGLNVKFPWISRSREFHMSVDNKFNTKIFARIWNPMQEARKNANSKILPHYNELQGIEKLVDNMSKGDREAIQHWAESLSPIEVQRRFELTDVEHQMARTLADGNIDIKRVMLYRRAVDALKREFRDNLEDPMFVQKLQEYEMEFGIDDAHKSASQLFDAMKTTEGTSLGGVLRMARAIANNEGTRDEFAKSAKLTGQQLAVANALDVKRRQMNETFGVDPDARFDTFMTHAREYYDGNIHLALKDFRNEKGLKKFYDLINKTGEVSAHVTDPIQLMQRFIKAGFDQKYFDPVLNDVRTAVREEFAAMAERKVPIETIKKLRAVTQRYISDIRGIPDGDRIAQQQLVDHTIKDLNFDNHPLLKNLNTREHLVNFLLSTGEAAAQGFRVAAAMRDFATGMIVSFANFGWKRTGEMLYYGIKGLEGIGRDELKNLGIIPESGIVAFADPTEYASGVLGRSRGLGKKINEFNQVAFKLSFQKDIYSLFHAGHYLSTFKRSNDALIKFRNGEMNAQQFRKELDLDTYDKPVIERYMELVKQGNNDEASRFLGIQTGQDMVGVYGLANHPSGWNTNVGRVAGQFGQWSAWFVQTMGRMASRGTWGQRGARLARLAAAQKVMTGVGAAMGFNLTRWQPTTGMVYGGGPVIDLWQAASDATSGTPFMQEEGKRKISRFFGGVGLQWPVEEGSLQSPISMDSKIKDMTGLPLPGPSLLLPGSFFLNDLVEAYQHSQETGDITSLGRAIGVPVMKK